MMRWKPWNRRRHRGFRSWFSTALCRFRKDCWMQSGSNHWWRVLVLELMWLFILNFYLWSKLSKEFFHAGGWGIFLPPHPPRSKNRRASCWSDTGSSIHLLVSGHRSDIVILVLQYLTHHYVLTHGRICRVEVPWKQSICITILTYTWFKGISIHRKSFSLATFLYLLYYQQMDGMFKLFVRMNNCWHDKETYHTYLWS